MNTSNRLTPILETTISLNTIHKLTENNFKFIAESLEKEAGDPVWRQRSRKLLQVAYDMVLYVQASQNTPCITIKDFVTFLELHHLQTAMITNGGMGENPVKAVADLKNYLITLPGFDCGCSCLNLGKPKELYKQHGFVVMQIISLINAINHKSLWID